MKFSLTSQLLRFALIILLLPSATEANTPIAHAMTELFDPDFAPTPEQQMIIKRLQYVRLDGLIVKELSPVQVLQAIQTRMVAAGVTDVRLVWDASIGQPELQISYTATEMSLANALFYLRRSVKTLHYSLNGNRIVAVCKTPK
jgi:hypothetical protein